MAAPTLIVFSKLFYVLPLSLRNLRKKSLKCAKEKIQCKLLCLYMFPNGTGENSIKKISWKKKHFNNNNDFKQNSKIKVESYK